MFHVSSAAIPIHHQHHRLQIAYEPSTNKCLPHLVARAKHCQKEIMPRPLFKAIQLITINMLRGIRQILTTELNKSLLHVIFKISLNNDLYHSTPIPKYKINIISGLDWMVGISDGVGNIVWDTRMDPVM